jgi:DNA-binding CsgD family transcriptional regulator
VEKSIIFKRLEREILELLCLGWSAKHIAYELEMSIATINFHLHRMAEKAAVTRLQLVIYALQNPACLERDGECEPGLHPPACPCNSPFCRGRRRAA